ncbi:hypothetical protein TrST_g5006 [Triparma strigata]|uniref:Uncharacterized protein n=1 Tax=Triparma strigata TaxID=1606541 RepID=A0A9W7ALG9_9STRA|nr:hypothetical protein TrST_g5006 [Triparma strigata]
MGGEDNEIWKELISRHGVSDSNNKGQVVVVTSQSESRAFSVLTKAPVNKSSGKPLSYSSFRDDEVGVWCANVALDGRGLMETVILKSGENAGHNFVYVVDVVSLAGSCPVVKGDRVSAPVSVFGGLREEINAAIDEIKNALSTVDKPDHIMKPLAKAKKFPISPAHPLPSSPPTQIPLVLCVTLDPHLFAATYTQKQALSYLTYMLRLYCHHLGASLVFVPDKGVKREVDPNESEESKIKWEKNFERHELLQKFVLSFFGKGGDGEGGGDGGGGGGGGEGGGDDFEMQEEDELFIFVPTVDKQDHLEFLKSTASCKNAWDAETDDYDAFVSKAIDKTDKAFVFKGGDKADNDVGLDEKEIDKIASYEWMRSLQSNMESDTREVEKKKETKPAAGSPEKSEDVSAFFTSLLTKK